MVERIQKQISSKMPLRIIAFVVLMVFSLEGLNANQKVSWTAKVDKGEPLNHGSDIGHFVHIVNN